MAEPALQEPERRGSASRRLAGTWSAGAAVAEHGLCPSYYAINKRHSLSWPHSGYGGELWSPAPVTNTEATLFPSLQLEEAKAP